MRKGKLNLVIQILKGINTFAVLSGYGGGADDLDRLLASTVLTSHVHVKGINGSVQGNIAVFTVHIVSAGTGVVFDPDAVVLHVTIILLSDLKRNNKVKNNNAATVHIQVN